MDKIILRGLLFLVLLLSACKDQAALNSEEENNTLITKSNPTPMNNYVSIFEIPATDFERALQFYQSILEIKIEAMEFEGMQMGLFPYENQAVVGTIVKGEDFQPSAEGVRVYLNGGENLQTILDRV